MTDRPTKVFGLMCLLVAVWTATYWLYKPGEPPVTFDRAAPGAGSPSRSGSGPGSGSVRPDPLAQLSPPRTELSPPSAPQVKPAGRAEVPAPPKPLPDRAARFEPPKFREYTVQQGDTGWQAIAQHVYGDRNLWQAVSRANPLVTPNKLIPGRTKLRIPIDPGNIQGKVIKGEPAPSAPPPGASAPKPAAPEKAEPASGTTVEYTIRADDTLSSIAKAFYGKATLWHTIADANTDRIPDPDHLPVGVKIIIPPR